MHFERAMLRYQVTAARGKDLSPSVAVVSLALEGWRGSEQLCCHRPVASTEAVRELNIRWLMTAVLLERM